MSICGSPCVLWDGRETLALNLIYICGDDGKDRSSIHHPEHRLKPTKHRDPFFCTVCKEVGFRFSYACGPCAVHLHRECVSPPMAMIHPLQECAGDLSFVRRVDDDHGGTKFCGACSKPMRGCGYKSGGGESCFHPCCLHLDRFIIVNGWVIYLFYLWNNEVFYDFILWNFIFTY